MHDLQKLLKDLYTISGLNLSVFDIDENLITSYPSQNSPFCALIKQNQKGQCQCSYCDHHAFERVKKTKNIDIYNCHFHLYEAVVPLYTYGVHTGYLMMGQTLTDSSYEKEQVKIAAMPYIKDTLALDQAIDKISYHSKEQILAYASIIDIYGKYFTLTNRIEASQGNLATETRKYIETHYQQEISIKQLCEYFYCSKATLMNHFKNEYGKTIHQYILDFRLQQSLALLMNKKNSIQQIAADCGFQDANYFSKSFKKKYQLTPSQYRENNK